MAVSRERNHKESKNGIGLLAIGTSGPWEVAIDETLSGQPRYFAQIEGPFVYVYFELATVKTIDEALAFFSSHARNSGIKPEEGEGKLILGKNPDAQVFLTRDDEYEDRFFLVIQAKSGLHAQFTISNSDLTNLIKALKDAKSDLVNEIAVGIEQADQGKVGPLNAKETLARVRNRRQARKDD